LFVRGEPGLYPSVFRLVIIDSRELETGSSLWELCVWVAVGPKGEPRQGLRKSVVRHGKGFALQLQGSNIV
jgi:hypothetical protein